jgi:hypothetical protein
LRVGACLCRDQLELLEDKLREYRALDSQQYEDKVGWEL